jgi:hypothetical protein
MKNILFVAIAILSVVGLSSTAEACSGSTMMYNADQVYENNRETYDLIVEVLREDSEILDLGWKNTKTWHAAAGTVITEAPYHAGPDFVDKASVRKLLDAPSRWSGTASNGEPWHIIGIFPTIPYWTDTVRRHAMFHGNEWNRENYDDMFPDPISPIESPSEPTDGWVNHAG